VICVHGRDDLVCRACRYAPETEAARIRLALARECGPGGRYDTIRFEAHNREEAESIRGLLTPDECARVQFAWWDWDDGIKFCDVCRRLWGRVEDETALYAPPAIVVCPSCWAKVQR
jgi:hypothetical protein